MIKNVCKKAIVTGAGGFIGSSVCFGLLQKGYQVLGICVGKNENISNLMKNKNFNYLECDFSNYHIIDKEISNYEGSIFYHFAWAGVYGDAFKDYKLQLKNAEAACDAIMLAKKIGCKKFVFAATNNEIDSKRFCYLDYFEPRFTNIYSSSKLVAELICKTLSFNYQIEYNAGMICMAYGEGNKSKMLANVLVENLINGVSPKLIEGNNLYDMIYIQDIVDAFIAIGEKGINMKTYYVGHRKLLTFKEWVIKFRNIINPTVELKFGEFNDNLSMDYSKVDLDALYNDTGFECSFPIDEGIKRTALWIKKQNN